SIDGPCEYTLPPYNEYVVLGPEDPSKVAKKVSESLGGIKVIITDINDLGGKVLGASHKEIDFDKTAQILKDNPLGQESEQTPMGIIREI
ncbi:MAG: F420-0--gamma-glutamyl ligase, partial [Oscillospiraceae bacterium]